MIELSHVQLGCTNLSGADFAHANMEDAVFIKSSLSEADLRGAHLRSADFFEAALVGTRLSDANLEYAVLSSARLIGADLTRANLNSAELCGADLREAKLNHASLKNATLNGANLEKADMFGADLTNASLVGTNLVGADLTNCRIYGISAWGVRLDDRTSQSNLIITPEDEPTVTVDNIELAQFIYLLLNNRKVRAVIDTITSRVVLILGRFSREQKPILDSIRNEARRLGFVPVLFDFDKPQSKDLTGTVETLARMARFIIADLTDPSSIPHELATVIPFLRTTPILPIKLRGTTGYTMFNDYSRSYPWVLPTFEYENERALIGELPKVITATNDMANRFRGQPA